MPWTSRHGIDVAMDRDVGVRPMRELDHVPWGQLRHAYGTAKDVPRLLRKLEAAKDLRAAQLATGKLSNRVWHQGNLCQATAPVLPFVFWLLQDRPGLASAIVEALADLDWDWLAHNETGSPLAAECRAALMNAGGALAGSLGHPDRFVRSHAAGMLGYYESRAAEVWLVLRERLRAEPDPGVQADLMISLAILAAAADRVSQAAAEVQGWRDSPDPARRCAAAHARCLLDPADPQPWAVLAGCLPSGTPLGEWWGSGSPCFVAETLARTTGGLQDAHVLGAALSCLSGPVRAASEMILRYILGSVFPEGHAPPAADLNPRQRQVAGFLASGRVVFAERGLVNTVHYSGQSVLRQFGLPADVRPLRRWLAGN